jgi:hypothetical protein
MQPVLTLEKYDGNDDVGIKTMHELFEHKFRRDHLPKPGFFRPQRLASYENIPSFRVRAQRDFERGDVVALYPVDILTEQTAFKSFGGYSGHNAESFSVLLPVETSSVVVDFRPACVAYNTLSANAYQMYRVVSMATDVIPNIKSILDGSLDPRGYMNLIPFVGDANRIDAFGPFIRDATYDVNMLAETIENKDLNLEREEEEGEDLFVRMSKKGMNAFFLVESDDEEDTEKKLSRVIESDDEEEESRKNPRLEDMDVRTLIPMSNCCVYLGDTYKDNTGLGALFAKVDGGLQRVLSANEFIRNCAMGRVHFLLVVASERIRAGTELVRQRGPDHWSGRYRTDFGLNVSSIAISKFMVTNKMVPGTCTRDDVIESEEERVDRLRVDLPVGDERAAFDRMAREHAAILEAKYGTEEIEESASSSDESELRDSDLEGFGKVHI